MTVPHPVDVFISYAPADEAERRELEKHLAVLEKQNWICPWHVGRVVAGQEHDAETAAQFMKARLILLLVSADYLDAQWAEMQKALMRHTAREARVIPLIIKACDWEHAPFAKLSALPGNRQPIASWPIQSEAWADVARGIRTAVEQFRTVPHTAATPSLDPDAVGRSVAPPPHSIRPSYATAHMTRTRPLLTGSPGVGGRPSSTNRRGRIYVWLSLALAFYTIIIIVVLSISTSTSRPSEDPEQVIERLAKELQELHGDDTSPEPDRPFTAGENAAEPVPSDETDLLGIPEGLVAFYDGNRGSGRMLGRIVDNGGQRINLVEDRNFIENDKARSCVLYNVKTGAVITIFDSPDGDRADDWTVITVKKAHPRYTVPTFESDIDDDYVQAKHMRERKLDGKVSRIEVD